ncbi:bifunctional hydroxymethylpyrimidine kinase/phosphomethylpyrimidine kinase [candidate division KSB1 bacterium]|nr:bifunctional hydroxymethylpyrimidine kinase/phosphomethylpyrimidine kinase [candidate division KSB1 bacterium]
MIEKSDFKRVLTIAGSDSSGGAGIQADLKTFSAFGVYGMSVITAVTAQNTVRVHGVEAISPDFVGLQFEAVITDIGVDAVKTGMLFSAEIIDVIALKLSQNRIPNVVCDPVMVAKSGDCLLQEDAIQKLKERLIPEVSLLTPNIPEAEALSGIEIDSADALKEAAIRIQDMGCDAVLIKGGHLKGDADDILYDGERFVRFSQKRIESMHTHGTGCTYSAAIAANLAKGFEMMDAVRISKLFVTEAIRQARPLGKGHGPLNHFVHTEQGKR